MLILPLKFIHEQDKKTVGINLFNLAKLNHLGLPVVESVVATAPVKLFEKIVKRHTGHNLNIHDNVNNIRQEILNLSIPEALLSLEILNFSKGKTHLQANIPALWQNLLNKWSYELISKITRSEKNLFEFTPQLIVFSANFSSYGNGYFDEDREHVVLKTEKGELSFKESEEIEKLIILANKKLVIPQIYYWAIEEGKIKILKVVPFTQSITEERERIEKLVPVSEKLPKKDVKTASKLIKDYTGEVITSLNSDGVLLRVKKTDIQSVNEHIDRILTFNQHAKIIFYPDFEMDNEKMFEYAKTFLFFKNKKKIDAQIILPQTFSKDEYLKLKRDLASLGIYSKGGLKIWKEFKTVQDFLHLEDYLDAGFDGAFINLDKIAEMVTGVKSEIILKEPRIDWLIAIEKFFKELGLSKMIKNHKQVLVAGSLIQNEELLNYFIHSGVWGFALGGNLSESLREHISFLEKQTFKKLISPQVKH